MSFAEVVVAAALGSMLAEIAGFLVGVAFEVLVRLVRGDFHESKGGPR